MPGPRSGREVRGASAGCFGVVCGEEAATRGHHVYAQAGGRQKKILAGKSPRWGWGKSMNIFQLVTSHVHYLRAKVLRIWGVREEVIAISTGIPVEENQSTELGIFQPGEAYCNAFAPFVPFANRTICIFLNGFGPSHPPAFARHVWWHDWIVVPEDESNELKLQKCIILGEADSGAGCKGIPRHSRLLTQSGFEHTSGCRALSKLVAINNVYWIMIWWYTSQLLTGPRIRVGNLKAMDQMINIHVNNGSRSWRQIPVFISSKLFWMFWITCDCLRRSLPGSQSMFQD